MYNLIILRLLKRGLQTVILTSADTPVLYLLVSAIYYLKSRKEIKNPIERAVTCALFSYFSNFFTYFLIFLKREKKNEYGLSGYIKMYQIGMTVCGKRR